MNRITSILLPLITLTVALGVDPATASAGYDVDGDGNDDLLIGARRADHTAHNGGLAALSLGSAAMEDGPLYAPPVDAEARAGTAVALGDFNCDGVGDYALGAPLDAGEEGRVYVYLSSQEGAQLETYGRADFAWDGAAVTAGDHFGRSLAAADFDADGCDDLAIGAPGATPRNGTTANGVVHVAAGRPNGLQRAWSLSAGGSAADAGSKYGFALTVGYVNADTYPDLVIGAPRRTSAGTEVGAAYVRPFNVNSGSFPTSERRALTPCDEQTCDATDGQRWFGWALAIGDLDGDGAPDVAVGRPGEEEQAYQGEVIVFDGSTWFASATTIALGSAGELFGFALAAGDLDADGADDLVIGAPYTWLPWSSMETGAVYLVTDGLSSSAILSPEDYETPTANKQRFGAAVALGDYYSAGIEGPDLVVGASRAKDVHGIRSGGVYAYYNDGAGTMHAFDVITLDQWTLETDEGALFGAAIAQ